MLSLIRCWGMLTWEGIPWEVSRFFIPLDVCFVVVVVVVVVVVDGKEWRGISIRLARFCDWQIYK